ncbi:MAG: histidine kinase [Gemmataceae bacterium]
MALQSSENADSLRRALADRLHDTVCQYAAALNAEAYMLGESRWRELDGHVQRIQQLAERLAVELRQLVKELRQPMPHEMGLHDTKT